MMNFFCSLKGRQQPQRKFILDFINIWCSLFTLSVHPLAVNYCVVIQTRKQTANNNQSLPQDTQQAEENDLKML